MLQALTDSMTTDEPLSMDVNSWDQLVIGDEQCSKEVSFRRRKEFKTFANISSPFFH